MVKVVGEAPEVVKRAVCRHSAAMLEYVPRDVKKRHDTYDFDVTGAKIYETFTNRN